MRENYSEQFEQFFNIIRQLSKICGLDLLRKDYQYNWITYILIISANLGMGFTIFTICADVANKFWTSVLITVSIFGVAVQGYVKLIVSTRKRNIYLIRYMHQTICDIYIDYEKASLEYRNELKLSLSRVKKIISILFILVGTVSLLVIGVPIFTLVVQGKRTFILNFFIPYIDLETDFGYYFTFVIHAICVLIGGFGNLLNDLCCFTFVAHVPLISNILKCKLHDLDKITEENPKDMEKSKPLLIDILKWHQKYNEYCDALRENYYWILFVQIGTEFLSIVCAILCNFLNLWQAAPAVLIYLLALFYCFCAVGNIVEVANSDVIFNIYDSKWYYLTASEQKMVLCMLRNAQQATGILIGDILPLSLSTALEMSKTFYSFSMLLREFLNK